MVKEKQWVSRSLLSCAYSSSGSQHGTLRFRRFSRYDEPSTLSLPISGTAPIEPDGARRLFYYLAFEVNVIKGFYAQKV
jgi:hypothetical protein